MIDFDFMRYSRQLLLENCHRRLEERVSQSKVLIAAALAGWAPRRRSLWPGLGVGTHPLADDDAVHQQPATADLIVQRGYRSAKPVAQSSLSQLNTARFATGGAPAAAKRCSSKWAKADKCWTDR